MPGSSGGGVLFEFRQDEAFHPPTIFVDVVHTTNQMATHSRDGGVHRGSRVLIELAVLLKIQLAETAARVVSIRVNDHAERLVQGWGENFSGGRTEDGTWGKNIGSMVEVV